MTSPQDDLIWQQLLFLLHAGHADWLEKAWPTYQVPTRGLVFVLHRVQAVHRHGKLPSEVTYHILIETAFAWEAGAKRN